MSLCRVSGPVMLVTNEAATTRLDEIHWPSNVVKRSICSQNVCPFISYTRDSA